MGFNRYNTTTTNNAGDSSLSQNYGVVYDVILDSTHPRYTEPGDIGAIVFRKFGNTFTSKESLPLAYPFVKNFVDLPIRNEMVEIVQVESTYCYRRYSKDVAGNKNLSSSANTINARFLNVNTDREDLSSSNKAEHYERVSTTQTPRSSDDGLAPDESGYGKVFSPANIHRLSLFEGDTLIESRFGQSIRLSAYNNPGSTFSPTLTIRNRESSATQILSAKSGSITEDVNRDGSTIIMSSGQYIVPFIPGTIDEKGSTDFSQKPLSFKPYPSELKGDQVLINSGRIILSARNAEMIFYSKGNYGFISDSGLSIDNKLGIDVNVGADINVVTNDRNVNIVSGNGSIFLGSKDLEPMVKGQKLVEILAELIDQIGTMVFLTPSGPTAEGPKNRPEFGKIKSKLNDILSKINQTA
ncbi:MAG: hypothetical protein EBS55_10260 [Flavobacteriaceae bacterium]|nr:hypothetical protein [Flavobacteriaceae bacterium]